MAWSATQFNLAQGGEIRHAEGAYVSGDFFSQRYFDAWTTVADNRPKTLFYGYTKSLKYWVKRIGTLPPNFRLVASYGGKDDSLIAQHNLCYARVVFSESDCRNHAAGVAF